MDLPTFSFSFYPQNIYLDTTRAISRVDLDIINDNLKKLFKKHHLHPTEDVVMLLDEIHGFYISQNSTINLQKLYRSKRIPSGVVDKLLLEIIENCVKEDLTGIEKIIYMGEYAHERAKDFLESFNNKVYSINHNNQYYVFMI